MFLGSYIINDLHRVNKVEILKKVKESTRFSLSFIVLLIGSSIVCTLGLLINSTAIVIGGMIMSPLMWPLMQTAMGISYGRTFYIKRSLYILIVATVLSLISAFLIAQLSPIKILNDEIIARTNPTLIDIGVSIVAGAVAALAITQPKISESLAGVAIATSLMPPIAVSGIGLALSNLAVFWGALLLFFANVVSIIFVAVLVFLWLGLRNESEPTFQIRAISVTAIILVITSIPLFVLLREYSFKTSAYVQAEEVLTRNFLNISPSIYLSNISTNVPGDEEEAILVEAEVLLPEELTVSYEQTQIMKTQLEGTLGRNVDLRLRIQNTISVLSKRDIENSYTRSIIEATFINKIGEIDPDLTIDSLDTFFDETSEEWVVNAVLRGDPNITFSYAQQQEIKDEIISKTAEAISMNVEIISRIKIQSRPELYESQIEQSVSRILDDISPEYVVNSINVKLPTEGAPETTVSVELKIPNRFVFDETDVRLIENNLEDEFGGTFDLQVTIIYTQQVL